jgi:hypothetical protein
MKVFVANVIGSVLAAGVYQRRQSEQAAIQRDRHARKVAEFQAAITADIAGADACLAHCLAADDAWHASYEGQAEEYADMLAHPMEDPRDRAALEVEIRADVLLRRDAARREAEFRELLRQAEMAAAPIAVVPLVRLLPHRDARGRFASRTLVAA